MGGPDDGEDGGEPDGRKGNGDRHEPLAGEESEIGRQRDAVVLVEQERGQQSDQDAAEDAGVDRLDAEDLFDLGAAPGRREGDHFTLAGVIERDGALFTLAGLEDEGY